MTRVFGLLLALLATGALSRAQTVSIGVFSLFHAKELRVMPAGSPLLISTEGGAPLLMSGERGSRAALLRMDNETMLLETRRVASVVVSARDGGEAEFTLAVPGRIRRRFRGVLTVFARGGELVSVVRMDMETAVASIVSAESVPGAGLEALKAQAVAARSYLAAGGRHRDYDFCDTTHCQFLRSPPAHGSPADLAARETRGLVLTWHGQVLRARYSSRCGGRTVSLRELGIASNGYPYFSVICAWCRRHPLPASSATSQPHGNARERAGGLGRTVGLCQHGTAGMAASGAKFDTILRHYYPETELTGLSSLKR
jgi:peptidoglycan hydrolase-like amidase